MSGLEILKNGTIKRCAWCGTAESDYWFYHASSDSFHCCWLCQGADTNQQQKNVERKSLSVGLCIGFAITIIIALLFQPEVIVILVLGPIILAIFPACVYLFYTDHEIRVEEYRKRVPRDSRYKEYFDFEKPTDTFEAIICPICGADVDRSGLATTDKIQCEFCGANLERSVE